MAAGATGGLIIVTILAWLFQDKVYNLVEVAFDKRKAALKERVQDWLKDEIAERETASENVRQNSHVIKGLREIMSKHDDQFKELHDVPNQLNRALELLEQGNKDICDVKEIADKHTVQIAVLIERRDNERSIERRAKNPNP